MPTGTSFATTNERQHVVILVGASVNQLADIGVMSREDHEVVLTGLGALLASVASLADLGALAMTNWTSWTPTPSHCFCRAPRRWNSPRLWDTCCLVPRPFRRRGCRGAVRGNAGRQ